MQSVFIKPTEAIFIDVANQVKLNRVIENTIEVIKKARMVGIPVIYIRVAHHNGLLDVVDSIFDIKHGKLLTLFDNMQEAEIIDELKPSKDDYIITKRRNNAFFYTDLELLLRRQGIDTVIVAGVLTDSCVNDTVIGARERHFHVIVLSNCCATLTKKRHDYWITNIFPRRGRVRTSDELIAAMSS